MLEIIAAMALFGLVALGITSNTMYALQINKMTEVSNTIQNLAMSKIEEFAGVNAATLDDGNDATETNVAVPGSKLTYTRITNITVNADNTRTVEVTVSCNNPRYKSTKTYRATFAVWG